MSGINAIDVQDLERGVYYLVVMLEDEQVVRKFVIIN
jgi:hypothetical protein